MSLQVWQRRHLDPSMWLMPQEQWVFNLVFPDEMFVELAIHTNSRCAGNVDVDMDVGSHNAEQNKDCKN